MSSFDFGTSAFPASVGQERTLAYPDASPPPKFPILNYIMLSSLRRQLSGVLDPEEIEYLSLTLFVFSFPQLPMDPVREGYLFDGWFTEPDGGKEVTTDTQFTSDTKLYAHWDKA